MSLLIGICTFPFRYAFEAYKQINCKLPQNVNSTSADHIKLAVAPFLNQVGIRKDIHIIEDFNLVARRKTEAFCLSQGTNLFKKRVAFIAVEPELYDVDADLCTWAVKTQICRIKYNNNLTYQLIPGISQLAISIFSTFYLSFFPAIALTMIVRIVAQRVFSRWVTNRADDVAIKHSTDGELKSAKRFFLAVGLSVTDRLHPQIVSRIHKINQALANRNITFDNSSEKRMIDIIKSFIKNKIRKYVEIRKSDLERECKAKGTFFGTFSYIVHSNT